MSYYCISLIKNGLEFWCIGVFNNKHQNDKRQQIKKSEKGCYYLAHADTRFNSAVKTEQS